MSPSRFALGLLLPLALAAQPESFIVTARSTRAMLNSLRILPDDTLLYGDDRVRGTQSDTLLTIPSREATCMGRMFGRCIVWSPAVYLPKPMAADSRGTIYLADPEKKQLSRYDPSSKQFVTLLENAGAPTALAADDQGGLYFNDPAGCRVR